MQSARQRFGLSEFFKFISQTNNLSKSVYQLLDTFIVRVWLRNQKWPQIAVSV
jgi:hypothetical protein